MSHQLLVMASPFSMPVFYILQFSFVFYESSTDHMVMLDSCIRLCLLFLSMLLVFIPLLIRFPWNGWFFHFFICSSWNFFLGMFCSQILWCLGCRIGNSVFLSSTLNTVFARNQFKKTSEPGTSASLFGHTRTGSES